MYIIHNYMYIIHNYMYIIHNYMYIIHNYMYIIPNVTNKTLIATKLSRSFRVQTDSMSLILATEIFSAS